MGCGSRRRSEHGVRGGSGVGGTEAVQRRGEEGGVGWEVVG